MKDRVTAGPAFCAAAAGVRAKRPAPIIAPIPRASNPGHRSERFSPPFSSTCASNVDKGFVRKRLMVCPRVYQKGDPRFHASFAEHSLLQARTACSPTVFPDLESDSKRSIKSTGTTLLRIHYAPEPHPTRPVISRSHQQHLAVLVVAIRLRKIPDRSLRLVVFATTHNSAARVLIRKLIRPLPYVAHQVHHAKGARAQRMRIHITGPRHGAAGCKRGQVSREKPVTPRIRAPIRALRRKLPLPFMRQPLAGPLRVGSRVLH